VLGVEVVELIKELLSQKRKVLSSWTCYLAAYKAIEGNLALFDKLARCRDLKEFQDAIYEAARVKDRVLEKLKEMARERATSKVPDVEAFASQFAGIFSLSDKDLEELMMLATKSEAAPRAVGSLVASFALLHRGPEQILEQKLRRESSKEGEE